MDSSEWHSEQAKETKSRWADYLTMGGQGSDGKKKDNKEKKTGEVFIYG